MQIVKEVTDRLKVFYKAQDKQIPYAMHALELQKRLEMGQDPLQIRNFPITQSRTSVKPKKVMNILGSTEEERLYDAVIRICLDVSTEEGYTIDYFCKNEDTNVIIF